MQDRPESFDAYHRWLGISPKYQPPNHYRLLNIDLFESDPEVIRDVTERQMAHVRRYQLGQYVELSQKILNELGAAKACLSNPVTKAAYDQELRRSLETSTLDSATRPAEIQAVAAEPGIPAMVFSDPVPLSVSSPPAMPPELPTQAAYGRRRVPIAKRPSSPFPKLMVVLVVLGVAGMLGTSMWYFKVQREVAWAKQEQQRAKREQEREKRDRLVQLQLQRDRVQNALKTAQEAQKAAGAAFQTKTRTAAYEQGKRLITEGTRAMEAGELDSAEQLFGQSSQSFAKSLAEAPAVSELTKAREAWTAALAAADKELLKKQVAAKLAAAQEKATAAEKQVAAGKLQEGVVLYRKAVDVLGRATTEAMAPPQRAEEGVAEARLPESAAPLKIQPIPPQTAEAGKPVSVVVSVENADQWKGKMRYSLGSNAPPGAKIEPETGMFFWTPTIAQAGEHEIKILVEDSGWRADQTTFTVTVATSSPTQKPSPIKLKEITIPLTGSVNLELVLIPAGEFEMGSTRLTHRFLDVTAGALVSYARSKVGARGDGRRGTP